MATGGLPSSFGQEDQTPPATPVTLQPSGARAEGQRHQEELARLMDRLDRQTYQMEEMQAKLQDAYRVIDSFKNEQSQQGFSSTGISNVPTVVHVESSSTVRLRVFTGLSPAGGNEVSYREWAEQAEQVLQDSSCKDKRGRLLSSLKGLALEHARQKDTARGVFDILRNTFGEVRSPEDLYLTFSDSKIKPKEMPSNFLLRLWSELTNINKTTNYPILDFNVKLYRTFVRGMEHVFSLLCLEVRNRFGFPGEAGPEPSTVLKAVKLLEGVPPQEPSRRAHHVHSHAMTSPADQARLSDQDVDRVAHRVAELLSRRPDPAPFVSGSSPGCRSCGDPGHEDRACPRSYANQGYSAARGRGNGTGFRGRGAVGPQRRGASTTFRRGSSF